MDYEKRESASAGTSVRGTENQEWVWSSEGPHKQPENCENRNDPDLVQAFLTLNTPRSFSTTANIIYMDLHFMSRFIKTTAQ
jgi:hypothetical protein